MKNQTSTTSKFRPTEFQEKEFERKLEEIFLNYNRQGYKINEEFKNKVKERFAKYYLFVNRIETEEEYNFTVNEICNEFKEILQNGF